MQITLQVACLPTVLAELIERQAHSSQMINAAVNKVTLLEYGFAVLECVD